MVTINSRLVLVERVLKMYSFRCDPLQIFVDKTDGSLGIYFLRKKKARKESNKLI